MTRRAVVIGVTVPMSLVLLGDRLELMRNSGLEVHVVVGDSSWGSVTVPEGIQVHVLPMARRIDPWRDFLAFYGWIRLLREVRPTAVVGASPKGAVLAMTASWVMRVPVRIFEVWGAPWEGGRGWVAHLLRLIDVCSDRLATQTLSVSASLSVLLQANKVVTKPPIVLGFGGSKGVDTLRFVPPSFNEINLQRPTLGFIGRVSAAKGATDLLEIFSRVKDRMPDARLLIVGDFDSTDPVDAITANSLRNHPDIEISGWLSHPELLVKEMDIQIFPSQREGLPNAVLEAAACGVPSVAFDVTGVRDAILPGQTGFLVEPGNNLRMSELCLELLFDSDLLIETGNFARRWVSDNFDSHIVAARYMDYLEKKLCEV